MDTITTQFQEIVGNRLKEHEPMSRHTHFRVGGPARWYTDVKTTEELRALLEIAQSHQVPVFVLGGGSNLLVSDTGFSGIVLSMAMRALTIEDSHVRAEAGVISAALARQTAEKGLDGLTWMISLPGTVGGAVRGNAGCFGGETRDHLTSIEVLSNGQISKIPAEEADFSYRESRFKRTGEIVLAAHFSLPSGDPVVMQSQMQEMLSKRKNSQPLYAGSAGCIFQNVSFNDLSEVQRLASVRDIPSEMQRTHRISAGWIVDTLGLKGTKIGQAQISLEHGNFLLNLGGASSNDLMALITLVKSRAHDVLGITLHEEVSLL